MAALREARMANIRLPAPAGVTAWEAPGPAAPRAADAVLHPRQGHTARGSAPRQRPSNPPGSAHHKAHPQPRKGSFFLHSRKETKNPTQFQNTSRKSFLPLCKHSDKCFPVCLPSSCAHLPPLSLPALPTLLLRGCSRSAAAFAAGSQRVRRDLVPVLPRHSTLAASALCRVSSMPQRFADPGVFVWTQSRCGGRTGRGRGAPLPQASMPRSYKPQPELFSSQPSAFAASKVWGCCWGALKTHFAQRTRKEFTSQQEHFPLTDLQSFL